MNTTNGKLIDCPSFSLGLTADGSVHIEREAVADTGASSSVVHVNGGFPLMDFSSIESLLFDDDDVKNFYDSINLNGPAPVNYSDELNAPAPMNYSINVNGGKCGIESSVVEKVNGGVSAGSSEGFLDRDEEFQKLVEAGGENPSIGVDTWALNRLQRFREHIGDQSQVELVDLMPHQAVPLLCQFFEQVTKENGKLYPTDSLMGLLRAFNQVLRKAQEKLIMDSGADEPAFNMKLSPMFRRVCVACSIAMKRSKDRGANLPRKKSKVVKLSEEKDALNSEYLAKTYPRGLQRRVVVFSEFRLSVRGGGELHSLTQTCFKFGTDEKGRYMIYDKTKCTKTQRPSMKKYQPEHFRDPLRIDKEDVVDTFERYFARLPEGMERLFLKPIDNPSTAIWYAKSNVGEGTLENLINRTFVETGVHDVALEAGGGAKITNKSGRTSMVTRMGESGVPAEVGMIITGHKSKGAYMRYDQSQDAKVRAAQRSITEEISYDMALAEEKVKLKREIYGEDAGQKEKAGEKEKETSPPKKLKSEPAVITISSDMTSMQIGGSSDEAVTQDVKGKGKIIDEEPVRQDVKMIDAVAEDFQGEAKIDADIVKEKSAIMNCHVAGRSEVGEGTSSTVAAEDYTWMDEYDWENDYQNYQRSIVVNPINAVFGTIQTLNNC